MIAVGRNSLRRYVLLVSTKRMDKNIPFMHALQRREQHFTTGKHLVTKQLCTEPMFNAPRYAVKRTDLRKNIRKLFTSPESLDYYKLLDVPKTATKKEIKMAYFVMAKKYHPDANPGDITAKEKFQKIAEAYTVLSDDVKRQNYDAYGFSSDRAFSNNQQAPNTDFSPLFNINPYDVFKEVFEDLGVDVTIKNIEKTKEEILIATNAAAVGDWMPAKKFASNNKMLIVGIMAPLILLVRFPWMIALLIRGGTTVILGMLTIIARYPHLAAAVGRVLYRVYMAAARRAANKKAGKK